MREKVNACLHGHILCSMHLTCLRITNIVLLWDTNSYSISLDFVTMIEVVLIAWVFLDDSSLNIILRKSFIGKFSFLASAVETKSSLLHPSKFHPPSRKGKYWKHDLEMNRGSYMKNLWGIFKLFFGYFVIGSLKNHNLMTKSM